MLDTIEAIRLSFYGLSAELFVGATLIVLLLCSMIPALRKDFVLLTVAFVGLLFYFYFLMGYEEGPLFNGMLVNTYENILLRKLFFFATLLALFQVAYQRDKLTQDKKLPEYLTMMFSIVLGGSLLVASRHFLMIFIAIELLSITAYIFTTLPLSMNRVEAAIKYLIFGGVSSGVMLYGISLIYATTGSLYIDADVLLNGFALQESWIVLVVWIMIFAGVLFKLAAFPMHIWSPDVYQAVPSMSAAFITTVPKLAAFGLIISLIPTLKATLGDTIWYEFLSVIAIITITAGNLGALRQQNVRRMLAYSSISHTGFLMVGLVAIDFEGLKNFMFYFVVYIIMKYAVFALTGLIERKAGFTKIEDYTGIKNRYSLIGVFFIIIMISLTGLPPTAGFLSKLLVFSSLLGKYTASGDQVLMVLFVVGLVNVVISLFYYLKIPYFIYFKSQEENKNDIPVLGNEKIYIGVLVITLVVLFIMPGWLLGMFNNISFAF